MLDELSQINVIDIPIKAKIKWRNNKLGKTHNFSELEINYDFEHALDFYLYEVVFSLVFVCLSVYRQMLYSDLVHNSAQYLVNTGVEKWWSRDTVLPHSCVSREEAGHASLHFTALSIPECRLVIRPIIHVGILRRRRKSRVPRDALNQTPSWDWQRLQASLVEIHVGASTLCTVLGYG